jgi:hypothetical protein
MMFADDKKKVIKTNSLSLENKTCITMDAQNVKDKKMLRFQKIQKLRGKSTGSDDSKELIHISSNSSDKPKKKKIIKTSIMSI